jgi:hypothetical protein
MQATQYTSDADIVTICIHKLQCKHTEMNAKSIYTSIDQYRTNVHGQTYIHKVYTHIDAHICIRTNICTPMYIQIHHIYMYCIHTVI